MDKFLIRYIYLIPLIISITLIIKYAIPRDSLVVTTDGLSRFLSKLIPDKKSKKYIKKSKKLKYIYWLTVEKYYITKYILTIVFIIITALINITNIDIYIDKVYKEFEYRTDPLYQDFDYSKIDKRKAFKEEIKYFNIAKKALKKEVVLQGDRLVIENYIYKLIDEKQENLELPKDLMKNKIYYRLYDYYKNTEFNYSMLFYMGILGNFALDIFLRIYSYFIKGDVKKELSFLKRLVVMHGSINDDFKEILKVLRNESKYYRPMMEYIYKGNIDNTVDNKEIYSKLISETDDIDEKLFLEKLDHMNNYDLKNAVVNLKNEIKLEKKVRLREIEVTQKTMSMVGGFGFFIIIGTLVFGYFLLPLISMTQSFF